ncbi:MAG: membrane dipeptidase, partial [Armatimonadetes bacterium]|nr:membrane dipeptidase [Armatimonadota bacterium]
RHGLALHAESLVFESYGFAPNSPVDGAALAAAIEAGASAVELQDLTEEMNMTRHAYDPGLRAEYRDAWDAAGVTCILQNAGEESNSIPLLLKRLARFTHVTDLLRDFVARAATPDDIAAAKAAGRHALYMSGNGVPLPLDCHYVQEELSYIRVFFQLGVRMMHLTYNRRNLIGDGCGEPANGGLSDFGRAVVAEMNRVGVIVDVAHCGWQTSLEAARASARPMVASHSGACAVNEHCRCKPDEVIRAICDTGGLIGLCCIPEFLGGSRDIRAFLDHIDYVVRTFGPDHVAIGTDVAYMARLADAERAKLPRRQRPRPRWEKLWPPREPNSDSPERQREQVLSMAWTNWPIFTVGMVQRGHSDETIRKILGGNMLRVAKAVWEGRGK